MGDDLQHRDDRGRDCRKPDIGADRGFGTGSHFDRHLNNFLFDPSETPHLSADRLSELLGVPKSTLAGKAKRIRDALGLDPQMDPEFCRRDLLAGHPLAWLVEVNGMVVDARWLPPEVQSEIRRRGLIPDIPLHEAA